MTGDPSWIPGTLCILVQGRLGDMHHLADLADGVLLFIVQFHGQFPLVPIQTARVSPALVYARVSERLGRSDFAPLKQSSKIRSHPASSRVSF